MKLILEVIKKMNKKKISRAAARHIRLVLIVFVLSLVFGGYFSFGQKRHMLDQNEAHKFKLAKQLYQKGQQLFIKEKFRKAGEAFNDCIEKFSRFADAHYYLGQIYYKYGSFLQALEHIEKAKKNYKFMADLGVSTQLEYMGELRKQKQDLEEQIRDLKQALSTGNYTVETGQKEIQARIAANENTLTKIDYRIKAPVPSVAVIPADYYYVHGNILFKLKKYKESLDQYLEAVNVNPKHGNAYVNIANLNYMARKYQKALYYLEKADSSGAKVNPEFRAAIYKAIGK